MFLIQLFALIALVALGEGLPTPQRNETESGFTLSQQSIVGVSLMAANRVNDCGDSSFINQSTGGSPLISDCQQITRNIAGSGTWPVAAGAQRQLVQYGTCALGAQLSNTANIAYVGNQDIIDLINTSIDKFSWDGKVGAKGVMDCQSASGLGVSARVDWGIYHT